MSLEDLQAATQFAMHAECLQCNAKPFMPCMTGTQKYKSLFGARVHKRRWASALDLGRVAWEKNALGGLYRAAFYRYEPIPQAFGSQFVETLRDMRIRYGVEAHD